jgi:hypothetical protein
VCGSILYLSVEHAVYVRYMCVCDRADIALVAESGAHASCCKLAFAPPVGSRVGAASSKLRPGKARLVCDIDGLLYVSIGLQTLHINWISTA